jgi:hypothetical protein
MNRFAFLIAAVMLLASAALAQNAKFTKNFLKIETGSTMDEVKKAIGKPDDIKPGFPKMVYSNGKLDMNGQLLYSTWFYIKRIPKSDLLMVYMVIFEKSSGLVIERKKEEVFDDIQYNYLD